MNEDARLDARATHVLAQLRAWGAGETPHGEGRLDRHLTDTYAVLRGWRQSDEVCLAGLAHSVYSTDSFTPTILASDRRSELRQLIGGPAERLVYTFCASNRRELLTAAEAANDASALRVTSRCNEGELIEVDMAALGALAVLHLANLVAHSRPLDRPPVARLHTAARWGQLARRHATAVPPVLDGCAALVTAQDERRLIAAYNSALANLTWPPAMGRLAEAVSRMPWVGEPYLVLALCAAIGDDLLTAAELTGNGEALLEQWTMPWDQRVGLRDWKQLAHLIRSICARRSGRAERAIAQLGAACADGFSAPTHLMTALRQAGLLTKEKPGLPESAHVPDATTDLPPRFRRFVASLAQSQPKMRLYPDLPAQPWYDPDQFEIVRELERAAPIILREARALETREFQEESEAIPRDGAWSVAFLYERGRRDDRHCAMCPTTTAIVERHRTHRSLGGMIYFSNLAPGTYVSPHHGPTNMRVRIHLGLDVPPNCGVMVDGQVREWKPGRCIAFNDRFLHEVWNWGDRRRLVLIVDLWHPDLSDREVELIDGLYRYAAAAGRRVQRFWHHNDAARVHLGGLQQ
jgi:aspartyl/asparaginyl beta-hydroxylase (cupin superfamily)